MALLPVEILFGVYLGLIAGIVPALIAGLLAFIFRYLTGVTLPGLGVVVLSVAIAGINGGLLGLIDPSIIQSPRLIVAILIVMMLSLYSHSQGDKLGASIPKRFSFRSIRQKTISSDVIEIVEGIGQVTVRPVGPINDIEGYPPLSPVIREEISKKVWRFPADLPLSELEKRLKKRLQTEYDFAEVNVSINNKGKATINAAPPSGSLSRRVPSRYRAASINGLVPTGLGREDIVKIDTKKGSFEGKILSAKTYKNEEQQIQDQDKNKEKIELSKSNILSAPTTEGGKGRITVTLPQKEAESILSCDKGQIIVQPRGIHREFEMISLFKQAGKKIRKMTVKDNSELDGSTLIEANIRDAYNIAILAIKKHKKPEKTIEEEPEWIFSVSGKSIISGGDEIFVVGTYNDLNNFEKAII